MNSRDNTEYGSVSPQLDDLSSTLMGDALDLLADGKDVNVLLVIQDKDNAVTSLQLSDDGPEALLQGARDKIRRSRHAVRYALTYEAAIQMDDGTGQRRTGSVRHPAADTVSGRKCVQRRSRDEQYEQKPFHLFCKGKLFSSPAQSPEMRMQRPMKVNAALSGSNS